MSPKSTIDCRSRRSPSSTAADDTGSGVAGGTLDEPARVSRGDIALAARAEAEDRERQRMQRSGEHAKRRQQEREHGLRVLADDELRHEVLADDDEADDRERQDADAAPGARPNRIGAQLTAENQDDAEEQARGDEQQSRLVEIREQRLVGAVALGTQAERQPHQGGEGRLHGADVDPGQPQQEQAERNQGSHAMFRLAAGRSRAPARSIPPPGRRVGATAVSMRAISPASRS